MLWFDTACWYPLEWATSKIDIRVRSLYNRKLRQEYQQKIEGINQYHSEKIFEKWLVISIGKPK
jgi:hypothetical protein